MSELTCYRPVATPRPRGPAWEAAKRCRWIVRRGEDLFVEVDPGGIGGPRAFVNGEPVVAGTQLLAEGDLVRLFLRRGRVRDLVVGRSCGGMEDGAGRVCQFTGQRIDSPAKAVRCGGCGGVFKAEVAGQLGRCPRCDRQFVTSSAAAEAAMPERELV
jgi:hypothetical protein